MIAAQCAFIKDEIFKFNTCEYTAVIENLSSAAGCVESDKVTADDTVTRLCKHSIINCVGEQHITETSDTVCTAAL